MQRCDQFHLQQLAHADASRRHATRYLVPWLSGKSSCLTSRQSVVRVHPGLLEEKGKDEGGRWKRRIHVLLFHPPPSPFHLSSALVVQPGVDACLSRRRAWVQIPSRALAARYANRQSGEAQTFATLWVRLPPLPLRNETCSPRLAVNQLSRNKRGGDEWFNSFTSHR